MDGFAVIPQPRGSEGFVALSRSKQGQVFEKHILNYGPLLYPGVKGGKVEINDAFADRLIKNFKNQVCDIVQVPLAGPNNEHSEDPDRNIGEVIGLVKRNKKIYAQIDVRDELAAKRMGKTLLGASAMLNLNYTDTRTLTKAGPTLLHVAVTNRPYIVGLDPFEEILAASALGAGAVDGMGDAVVLTAPTTEEKMTLDEMLAELRADHGIDVLALQQKAAAVDGAVSLTNAVQDALTEGGLLTLSNDGDLTPSADDLVGSIKTAGEKISTLSEENVTLSNEIGTLKETAAKTEAEAKVDGYVRSGHILPKNRDAQVTLLLSNADLFEALLPENPVVRLSHESGTEPVDQTPADSVQAEVERLAAAAATSRNA